MKPQGTLEMGRRPTDESTHQTLFLLHQDREAQIRNSGSPRQAS